MITRAADNPFNDVDPIKTGTMLDKLSGIYGIPRKRITEIWGPNSTGKTTLMLQAVAFSQKNGTRWIWVDAESSYEDGYARSLGVDTTKMDLLQDEIAEVILTELNAAIRSGKYDGVVIDSVGAFYSRTQKEKKPGEKTIGTQASLVAQFCRDNLDTIKKNNIAIVFINHGFTDIQSTSYKPSGGEKLGYFKSFSVLLKWKGDWVKRGDEKVGKVVYGTVKKNKLAKTEGLELPGTIIFGEGFSAASDLLDEALAKGVITKTGNLHYFEGEKLGFVNKVRDWLKVEENANKVKERVG